MQGGWGLDCAPCARYHAVCTWLTYARLHACLVLSRPYLAMCKFAAGKPWHMHQREFELNQEEDEAFAVYDTGGDIDPASALVLH